MADRTEDFLRRPLYMFSLPADVLATLTAVPKSRIPGAAAAAAATTTAPSARTPSVSQTPPNDAASDEAPAAASCALCRLSFDAPAEKRSHLKSDLHLFNLKQKMSGKPPVSEDAFDVLLGELDESLSGSEDSASDADADSDTSGGNDATSVAASTGTVLSSLLRKQAMLADRMADDAPASVQTVNRPKHHKQRQREAAASAPLQPLIWFSSPLLPPNTFFGAYRAMFTPDELSPPKNDEGMPVDESDAVRSDRLVAALRSRQLAPMSSPAPLPPPPSSAPSSSSSSPAAAAAAAAAAAVPAYAGRHIFLLMLGGGHAAAMVVALPPRPGKAGTVPMNREATVLAHKTFHRYTTRRKQGGSQSANDAAKGNAHSAGAHLRRYNEAALASDVRLLLQHWRRLIDSAELLFVRAANAANQSVVFGSHEGAGGPILSRDDPRLRRFPFSTRRPTQNEIMRCFIKLTRLEVRAFALAEPASTTAGTLPGAPAGADEDPAAALQRRQERLQERREAARRAEEKETALLHTSQLQALARRSKVPALLAYLTTHGLTARDFRFAPPDAAQHHHAPTLLHYAASQNAPALVTALLLRADADPTATNGDGKTPFELAGDRPTRDAFRVARSELGERRDGRPIDWDAAKIPAPLSRAEAERRDAREKDEAARKETERRRAEEARLQQEAAAAAAAAQSKSGSAAPKQKRLVGVLKTAQEIREEEARGLTPEQRLRLERERRARAAEARMRQAQGS